MTIKKSFGFTIVELLIVIVVVAILASIALVSFNAIRQRAYDSAVKNDLANFSKKIAIVKEDNGGVYPSLLTVNMGFRFNRSAYQVDEQGHTLRYCTNPATEDYIMYARSKSGDYFSLTAKTGITNAVYRSGFFICSQIGLVSTNPTNGLQSGTWVSWTSGS